ncbi:MAG: hypothetical protein H7141_06410 [Burkholderiales bacterium]|nr:hypothetical protein [Bacteroidia bacterium]
MGTKFNLNRQPVPDEEINSHKDFGELVNKFKKQSIEKARSDVNFSKNKKATYSAIIAGVAVICTVTYFSVFKKEPPKETTNDKIVTKQQNTNTPDTKSNKAFIAPPISKLNIPYTSYTVKSEQGATLKHKSNSKIIIPKKAFVNKQGLDIVGDVEIKYREFHNQADIIASGIPMTYDSAGVQTTLESAGMIDIKGYQNGEPVFINPKKQITVEFQSEHTADRYNMYVLDTIAKNWVYVNRDNSLKKDKQSSKDIPAEQLNFESKESEKIVSLQKQIDAIPPKIEMEKVVYSKKVNQLSKVIIPTKPAKATDRPQFELEVNYKEFPELEAFKNAVFEVGTENKNFSSKLADITWSSAEISEGPIKGKNYLLTLKLKDQVEKLIVYPTLTGADYDKALKVYESKFNDYKHLVAKREADEKKLKEEFEAKQAAFAAELKKFSEDMIKEKIRWKKEEEEALNKRFQSMSNQDKVTRIFNVSSFGICNSDCPTSMPKGEQMSPIYTINSGGTFLRAEHTYLVCHSKNVVFNFYSPTISYDLKDTYSLCVLSNGKMYLCNKDELGKCLTSKQNKIPVKELSADVNDSYDLKKALGI